MNSRQPLFLVEIVIVTILLSSCGAQAVLAPSSIPSPADTITPMLPAVTSTPPPTFTPELPTKTPEPTATPEPTEIPRVRLSADIDAPAFVPWEDLMAGRIEPAEPAAFADDAQFEVRYKETSGLQCDPAVGHIEELGASFIITGVKYKDASKRPVQIVGFGRTTDPETGMELGIVLEAVHNRDGSTGRWTFLFDIEQFEFLGHWFMDGQHYFTPMRMDRPSRDGSRIRAYGSRELHAVAHRTAPDLLADIDEFVATGIWTPEMDRPMAGYGLGWIN
jgi:hypothetical protein